MVWFYFLTLFCVALKCFAFKKSRINLMFSFSWTTVFLSVSVPGSSKKCWGWPCMLFLVWFHYYQSEVFPTLTSRLSHWPRKPTSWLYESLWICTCFSQTDPGLNYDRDLFRWEKTLCQINIDPRDGYMSYIKNRNMGWVLWKRTVWRACLALRLS